LTLHESNRYLHILLVSKKHPTLSLGISLSSDPYFKNTFPAVCCGFIPIPSSVMMADVAGGTLNSSAANFSTAVNGVFSGTLSTYKKQFSIKHLDLFTSLKIELTLKGSLGSEVRMILNVTLELVEAISV